MFASFLALIELTTPAMLGGLALLSLPLIAHLMNRRARRLVVFPTIQLLRTSTATQSRLFRLRRWILLCLRCLAVGLLALAFARPVWLDAKTKGADLGKTAGVVLLIDVSASTAQRGDGVSVIDQLRAAAGRTLDSLTSGTDLANVVVASARPRAIFPKLSRNLPALREELVKLQASYERSDLLQALALSGQMLAPHEGSRRLVILSDLQATNWKEVIDSGRGAGLLPPETQVTVIDVEMPVPDNVALSSPRQLPAQPLLGQPIQYVVHVGNFSKAPKQVRLSVTVDGRSLPSQTIGLVANEQRDVAVDAVLQGAAEHDVAFEIPPDGLAADNRAFLVVKGRQRLRVIIVSDDDPNEPGTASYFLLRALAPHADGRGDRYDARHVSSGRLTNADLAETAAVFVGYLGELSPASARTMIDFMERGGGLLFFCGEGAVRQNLQTLERAAGNVGVLPWETGPIRGDTNAEHPLAITGGKWQSRPLREFDEQSQLVVSQIRFARAWSTGPLAPQATAVLSFSDGTPALASRPVGGGQFFLANFSPAAAASDLGKYGSFVALVQSLARQLSPGTDASEPRAIAGEDYRYPQTFRLNSGPGGLTVVGPNNEPAAAITSVEPNGIVVRLPRPSTPGFYHFLSEGQVLARTAINVDKRESNLERVDGLYLRHCFEVDGRPLTVQSADAWKPLGDLRGKPLWGWCVSLALATFGLELFCLGYWRR